MQYGGSLIFWKSKKQTIFSSKGLIKELNIEVPLLIYIRSDNKLDMKLAANLVYHKRTKHIEINWHFIREKITQGLVSTKYIPTQDQPTDLLIKDTQNYNYNISYQNYQF